MHNYYSKNIRPTLKIFSNYSRKLASASERVYGGDGGQVSGVTLKVASRS